MLTGFISRAVLKCHYPAMVAGSGVTDSWPLGLVEPSQSLTGFFYLEITLCSLLLTLSLIFSHVSLFYMDKRECRNRGYQGNSKHVDRPKCGFGDRG